VIHYHGGPIWPQSAATAVWSRRHGLTSFAHPEQVALMAELCQSFALDNGAFTFWKAGKGAVDVAAYAAWVKEWDRHPGFDFCLIPDVIDGSEFDNDRMIAKWCAIGMRHGVPVWHLHEELDRLRYLVRAYPRVALGSSGQWATPGTRGWWMRMNEAMAVACDEQGRPKTKLHGLRMLSADILARLPLASADSCNVAMNIGIDKKWAGPYQPVTESMRAQVLTERIEMAPVATHWRPIAANAQTSMLDLFDAQGDAA
jgi:hypothetical protein